MTPLTFITGVLLGTSASICLGLLVVLLLFVLLGTSEPQVATELAALARSAALFFTLTIICGASFIALLRQHAWRWPCQAVMWPAILGVVLYYVL